MPEPTYTLNDLLALMNRLRDPETGCPWDVRQSFASIVPSTLEEAYELADAIESGDADAIREELGDVLFQVVFYSQLGRERGWFDMHAVIDRLTAKLLRRHPHVFPDGTLDGERPTGVERDEAAVKANWERIKHAERTARAQHSLLDDIPRALPALTRATKLQKRVTRVGFDWHDATGVRDKLEEELRELDEACHRADADAVGRELGDVLFTLVNLSRHAGHDAETVLREANRRFEARFRHMEAAVAEASSAWDDLDGHTLETLWRHAKTALQGDKG